MQASRPARQAGFTLIEASATLALSVALLGAAIPSFQKTLERRTLEGRAAELTTDLQYLRSEVVSRNRGLRIAFRSDAAGSCYVIHSGTSGACSCDSAGVALCNAGAEAVKTVGLGSGGVRLQANVTSMFFDPLHGTVSPTGTLRVIDTANREIRHVVNLLGRVRSCSPGGEIPGQPAC